MPSYLARMGVAVFGILLFFPLLTERPAAGSALIVGGNTIDPPALRELARTTLAIEVATVAVAGLERAPDPVATVASVVVAPAPVVAAVPAPAIVPAPVQDDAIVLASWYGPGFYGNRTACGQLYSPEILGVAHLTLPCGTLLTLTYGPRSLTVAVIDRGPYIAGRTLDLSNATKIALGCTDLCTLRMQVGR